MSVPLVIEKVYKKQLLPIISKPHMKALLMVPGVNKVLHNKIREKLVETFGGRFKELVIGGASIQSLMQRNSSGPSAFAFTVGYGMTECGPLISYDGHGIQRSLAPQEKRLTPLR
ncbi:MAG: hypothetical protein MZV63_37630 [Marinilabiliales bacterium]|nr:hypothetical protein [Marinilabiliales bacterium]